MVDTAVVVWMCTNGCKSHPWRRASSSWRKTRGTQRYFQFAILNTAPVLQADKRAHHNALERKRRDHIKDSFHSLRDSVPALQGEKVSNEGSPLSTSNTRGDYAGPEGSVSTIHNTYVFTKSPSVVLCCLRLCCLFQHKLPLWKQKDLKALDKMSKRARYWSVTL